MAQWQQSLGAKESSKDYSGPASWRTRARNWIANFPISRTCRLCRFLNRLFQMEADPVCGDCEVHASSRPGTEFQMRRIYGTHATRAFVRAQEAEPLTQPKPARSRAIATSYKREAIPLAAIPLVKLAARLPVGTSQKCSAARGRPARRAPSGAT